MAKNTKQLSGWRIIFKYFLEYKREIVVLSALGVISALANGTVPYIVGSFFDAILDMSSVALSTSITLPSWAAFLILWGVVQAIANTVDWVIGKQSSKIGALLYASYQSKAFGYLLKLPLSFHVRHKSGVVWDKITRAGNALWGIVERVVITTAPQLLSVVVGFTIAFFIHPVLATVLIVGLLLYIGTLFKIVPPLVKLQRKGHKAWNKAYGDAHDALTNVQAVKQSTTELYENKKISRRFVSQAARLWYKIEQIWAGINFYQRVVVTLTQLTIFVLAVHFIQAGELTIGGLIALNGYAAMILGPFVRFGYNWQTIQNGVVAIERAEKLLKTPTENYTPRNLIKLQELRGEVEFKNVSFTYKKNEPEVLNNVSFKVTQGKIIALVGESGVGKSTVVDLISGYYFPDKGKVLIDGHDIKKLDLEFLRKNIAVVPQEIVLFNDTIKINIKYGNFGATDEEVERAAKAAHADVFIEKFSKKYNQVVGERGIKLSVGQKQRVAIARAILRNPRILILDEPTSALDIKTEQFIAESLEVLMEGRTTFIIAHRLSTVRNADKIIVFDKGKIVEKGRHEELIRVKGGAYQRLYELHVGLQ